jgi:hypothetical protein
VARKRGWTALVTFLLGVAGASIFWLYGPYAPPADLAKPEAAKGLKLPGEAGPGGPAGASDLPLQALGPRYQMLSDGKQIFLVDLKEGRVWRYYHLDKEGVAGREEEGFLPLALYYGGKKHYAASELEAPPVKGPEPAPPEAKPQEKKPK